MARLDTIREQIVPQVEEIEVPSTRQVVVLGPAEDDDDDVEESFTFDDEDFWNALDLMETSHKMITVILRTCRLSPSRRRLLQNHADDLKMFTGDFPTPDIEDLKP